MIAADFHGSVEAYKELKRVADEVKPDKIVLLGDLVDGSGVYPVNNELDKIYYPIMAVRGNCDYTFSEQDLHAGEGGLGFCEETEGRRAYYTHGHVFGRQNIPPMLGKGDVLFFGHYHVPEMAFLRGILCVCVGSMGRPRGDIGPTYALFDGESVKIVALRTGKVIVSYEWERK